MALAVKSRHDICAEMGVDFDDVIAQIEQENALLAEKGISVTITAAVAAKETEDDETKQT